MNTKSFSPTRDYVVAEGFRKYPHGWQFRMHLVDAENGIYKLKNSDEMFTATELDAAVSEGKLKDMSTNT
ncbi:hypothetical protein HYW59_04635 [Candidatus Kaiserbacteria bacterium]|nr:hypothetical protein [Candidatus Kaiserbacteria bacterium]